VLTVTDSGLFCAAGGFHIDPWRPVDRALITHAHSDHARGGSRAYLCAADGAGPLRARLGAQTHMSGVRYGESLTLNGVTVSFHPAGHVLGSAQIRVEHRGEVWVVSGDYKRQPDPTCAGFEPVKCHTFVTESTFGLPVYRWPDPANVFAEINAWWQANQQQERTSVLFAYSLGKAQRLLAGVDAGLGPIFVHASIQELLPIYAAAGVRLPPVKPATKEHLRAAGVHSGNAPVPPSPREARAGRGELLPRNGPLLPDPHLPPPSLREERESLGAVSECAPAASGGALVIAPPAVNGSQWLNGLGEISTAFASGWMLVRGTRRRLNADRGFVLSDHADWPALIQTIRETGAARILVTHGATGPMVRWLREEGWQADSLRTQFHGETEEKAPGAADETD
jgi:putative mRNA 3-end processing factor